LLEQKKMIFRGQKVKNLLIRLLTLQLTIKNVEMNLNQLMVFDQKNKLRMTTQNVEMNVNQLLGFDRKNKLRMTT